MVIWVVGLSGAGKTTIGRALYEKLKINQKNVVFVDGDEIRSIFKNDQHVDDYSINGRRSNAQRIQALCAWLDRQSIDVVCCAISMFQDVSDYNRNLFSTYKEIYIDVAISKLVERDNKGLYQAAIRGETKNVVGIDIEYFPPTSPDLVIYNSMISEDVSVYVSEIMKTCGR